MSKSVHLVGHSHIYVSRYTVQRMWSLWSHVTKFNSEQFRMWNEEVSN